MVGNIRCFQLYLFLLLAGISTCHTLLPHPLWKPSAAHSWAPTCERQGLDHLESTSQLGMVLMRIITIRWCQLTVLLIWHWHLFSESIVALQVDFRDQIHRQNLEWEWLWKKWKLCLPGWVGEAEGSGTQGLPNRFADRNLSGFLSVFQIFTGTFRSEFFCAQLKRCCTEATSNVVQW